MKSSNRLITAAATAIFFTLTGTAQADEKLQTQQQQKIQTQEQVVGPTAPVNNQHIQMKEKKLHQHQYKYQKKEQKLNPAGYPRGNGVMRNGTGGGKGK